MSYSRIDGKDEIHFVTKSDLKYMSSDADEIPKAPVPQTAPSEAEEQYPGAVSPDGNINWDCPCLGGLGNEGPCVDSFKDAFSCWFFSESEEKGEECVEKFFNMSDCMKTNTEFYDDLNARNKAESEKLREEYTTALAVEAAEEATENEMITANEDIDLDVLGDEVASLSIEDKGEDRLIFETIADLADAPTPTPFSEPASAPVEVSAPAPVAVSIDTSDLLEDSYSDKVHSFSSVIVAASSEEEESAQIAEG